MKGIIVWALFLTSFLSNAQVQKDTHEQDTALENLHLDWLDSTIRPQDDFYLYANGNWKAHNPIPADYSSWGSFTILEEKNRASIHKMLIEASENTQPKKGSLEQKIGDFYFSGMDEEQINRLGIDPLKSEFALINDIQSTSELQTEIAHLHHYGINCGFAFMSMQDFKDSTKMIGAIVQSGLSLPDRDYYLKADKKFADIRRAYLSHIQTMFQLLGDTPDHAAQEAKTVLHIETLLAKGSLSQIAQRDPHAIYHVMTTSQLQTLAPDFIWSTYFEAMGQPHLKELNVAMPDFMRTFNQLLTNATLDEWKTYLRWHLLDNLTPYLSKPFVNQDFKMNALLTGKKKLPDRWKQVEGTESELLGFAIGELYVKKHFSPAAKQEVLDIIAHIRKVLRHDLQHLQWMSTQTRLEAVKKLDMIEERVGYPEKWRDYTQLHINRGPYVLNVLRGSEFLIQRELNKIGKPIDRTEWAMTPQTVNAYYDPSMNNINIPMGILQSPYFDTNASLAVNYGGIGVVIGHEITHGFDDQGAQFDGHGNLHNWWTKEDLEKFKSATQCIANQFSKYTVNDNIPVQGALVVGEATADLGGLMLAYRAFQSTEHYKQQKTIQGFTPDQQFFMSFAHIWANNMRPEKALNLITIDPHPPMEHRVNGTLANCPEFKKDFHIPDHSNMVNPEPCKIW